MLFVLGGLFALYESYEKVREALGEDHTTPSPPAGGGCRWPCSSWPWCSRARACGPRSVSRTGPAAGARGCASCARPSRRSCRSCCSRTSPPSSGSRSPSPASASPSSPRTRCGTGSAPGPSVLLLVGVAAFLAVEMGSLLVGEAASAPTRRRILEALESPEVVDRVINSRTMHLGPDEVLVAAKLAVGRHRQRRRGHRGHQRGRARRPRGRTRAAPGHLPRTRPRRVARSPERRRPGNPRRPARVGRRGRLPRLSRCRGCPRRTGAAGPSCGKLGPACPAWVMTLALRGPEGRRRSTRTHDLSKELTHAR